MTKILQRYEFTRGSSNLSVALWDTAGWASLPALSSGDPQGVSSGCKQQG
jgi:hypothetical protein